jgi:hypothetical protein
MLYVIYGRRISGCVREKETYHIIPEAHTIVSYSPTNDMCYFDIIGFNDRFSGTRSYEGKIKSSFSDGAKANEWVELTIRESKKVLY